MTMSPKTMMSAVGSRVGRFRDDCRGLAATEFALVVPLMLLCVFGTIEVTNGFSVNRKVYQIARTLSDLTSRASSVSSTDVDSFFTVGAAIMQPYVNSADTPLDTTISEIYIDPKTSAGRVQWSRGSKAKNIGDPVTVPATLINKDSSGNVVANQYLILSEVGYLYKPVIGYVMNKAGITLSGSTYTRPRQSTCVYYPASASNCPTS